MKKKQIVITSVVTFLLLAYVTAIVIIDPYNYFNNHLVNQDIKNRIAFPLNERLSKIIEYKKTPSPNILIGDSRIQNINTDHVKAYTGASYYNFGYGGCNLPELVETFWYAANQQKLQNVCICISFGMYNKYNNTNLFSSAKKSSSWFNYIFNSTNFRIIFYMAKDAFSKDTIVLGIPEMKDKEKFWVEKVDEQTKKFYRGYKYPDDFFAELQKIKTYCAQNKINLFFFIPPEYIELQDKVKEFSLTAEQDKFLNDIRSMGKTYDFNIDNKFNRTKENFFDPFHFRRDIDSVIIKPLFVDTVQDSTNNMVKIY
jgi:hypothetical protein